MPVKRVASTSRPGPARPSQALAHPAERSTSAALGGGDWEEFKYRYHSDDYRPSTIDHRPSTID
ncbi:MAG: hypothetical protein H7315_09305 [Herminiimonas sp.]|nr:hypothetical protein [Herminiimonas sp.]